MLMRLVEKIRTYSQASTEADTDYYGFLSYAVEWHAFTWGLFLGVATGAGLIVAPELAQTLLTAFVAIVAWIYTGREPRTIDLDERYLRQIKKEPHYFIGAWAIGMIPGSVYGLVMGQLPDVGSVLPFIPL